MATADWANLERELDAWEATDQTVTLWWRDDDAVCPTPALDRLLGLADGLPLALAVIPGQVDASLARHLADYPQASVLQHGWMHANHAPPDAKKAELGPHRPSALVIGELDAGMRRLADVFGDRALPILTPPWNRIASALVPLLSHAGYRGLSTAGPRPRAEPSPGLRQVNTHVDLVAWRSGGFIGTGAALALVIGHLAARRAGTVDAAEPTGLLTHHLVMDRESVAFVDRLVALTRVHRAARWLGAAEVFAAP